MFDSIGVPVDFEELYVSEVNPKISVPFDLVIESIKRNGIALKGILSTPFRSPSGELGSLNMKIRKQLDLFANVVHIKSMEGELFAYEPRLILKAIALDLISFCQRARLSVG